MGAQQLEVEVKFFVADRDSLRRRLLAAGAEPLKPRLFERNLCFDTGDEILRERFQLLRLRQDDRVRLTFKGPAPVATSEAKVREEVEVEVGDFEAMKQILEKVGFVPQQVYEKYRESFRLGEVEVVLDQLPFGDFVELEGDASAIRAAASALALPWEERVLINYLGLFALLREHYALPFADLTFANFEGLALQARDLLAQEIDFSEDRF